MDFNTKKPKLKIIRLLYSKFIKINKLVLTNNGPNWHINKHFSIIELMTVILVVLLLISLLIPTFINLKMNARTALCQNNLRQVGILITSYQSEHNGHLPNDSISSYLNWKGKFFQGDLAGSKSWYMNINANNELYSYWNGHLLPYLSVNLPDKYKRYAMVTKYGTTRFSDSQLKSGLPNKPPSDVLKNGWVVVDDALNKGGYQDLKLFICPEIHGNTFDIAVSTNYNGLQVPRISQLCASFGFGDGVFNCMNGGIPTTYCANDEFFGLDNSYQSKNPNSLRIDQIAEVSKKAFLLEGGLCNSYSPPSDGSNGPPYYSLSQTKYAGDLWGNCLDKTSAPYHRLSFVHDNIKTFWIMTGYWWYHFPNYWMGPENKVRYAQKFNLAFKGKAYMVTKDGMDYTIVSYIDPENGTIFADFFTKNPHGSSLQPFIPFVDEPNDYKYLVGNMNVLFGDGSVATKEQQWLIENRTKIGTLTHE